MAKPRQKRISTLPRRSKRTPLSKHLAWKEHVAKLTDPEYECRVARGKECVPEPYLRGASGCIHTLAGNPAPRLIAVRRLTADLVPHLEWGTELEAKVA